MRQLRKAALELGLGVSLMILASFPADAGSQSSNSSSNCSSGRCTRVDTHIEEDKRGTWGWTRYESWDERPRPQRNERAKQRPGRREYDNDDDD